MALLVSADGPVDSSPHGYAYEHHWWRCVRRLVSRTAELPRDGRDWVSETLLCPDKLDNTTFGGGQMRVVNRTTGIHGPPPIDFCALPSFLSLRCSHVDRAVVRRWRRPV